jgi:hypothetical protein
MATLKRGSNRNHQLTGKEVRSQFVEYFNNEGKVLCCAVIKDSPTRHMMVLQSRLNVHATPTCFPPSPPNKPLTNLGVRKLCKFVHSFEGLRLVHITNKFGLVCGAKFFLDNDVGTSRKSWPADLVIRIISITIIMCMSSSELLLCIWFQVASKSAFSIIVLCYIFYLLFCFVI